jgi:hypothetical protein
LRSEGRVTKRDPCEGEQCKHNKKNCDAGKIERAHHNFLATGAGYGEKNPLRTAQRNGYRERDLETRAGTVELRIPKLEARALTFRASWSRGGWPRRR